MRQSSNSGRRLRGRPNRNKSHGGTPNRNSTFESNGPEGKVRGNAAQVFEKYLALAREATAGGNRVGAEAFYQHAEHYFRIMNDSTDPRAEGQQGQAGRDGLRQPYRNGADGDGQGRPRNGGVHGEDDQGDETAAAIQSSDSSGDRSSGESSGDERQPRARTPRDQLRRGRAQRGHGGDFSRNAPTQGEQGTRAEGPGDAETQEPLSADAISPAAADGDAGRSQPADGAPNAVESEAESTAPRRSRKTSGASDAPRRGRPRKAKTAEREEPAAGGESGESAA